MGTRERPEVAGDYAHDAPDTTTAFPVKIGGYASTAPSTAVAEGDRVQANFDLQGRQRVLASGMIASDSPHTTTSHPVMMGGLASTAPGTAVGEADAVIANFDLQGRQRVLASGMIASDGPHTTTSHPIMLGGLASAVLGVAVGEADAVIANFALDGRQRNIVSGMIASDGPHTTTSHPVMLGGLASTALGIAVGEADAVIANFDLVGRQRVLASGMIAHDDPNTTTSHPVKIGGIAKEQDGTDPGSVAEDDAVDARFDRQGMQYINIGHPYFFQTSAAFSAAQTVTTAFIAAPGAGLSLYVTDVIVGANTAGQFHFANSTTAPATMFRTFMAEGKPFSHSFRVPIKLPAATNLGIMTDVTVTSVNLCGYIAP